MTATHKEAETVPQLFYQAVRQVMQGSSDTMLALWSEQEDVTYITPQGHSYQGHRSLVAYWQRAAQVNSQEPGSIEVSAEMLMMYQSGDIICTVMIEHIQVKDQDQILRQRATSTNIYRHEKQQWRMIHRHSGLPSAEE